MSVRPKSRTLGDLLDEMAAARPHAQALSFRHEQLSYAALRVRVDEQDIEHGSAHRLGAPRTAVFMAP